MSNAGRVLALLLVGGAPSLLARQPAPVPDQSNTLSPAEQLNGWRLLFDGHSTAGWHNFRKTGPPAGWAVVDGALTRTGEGGDIVTDSSYANFELQLDWKISPNGNSGILYRVSDDQDWTYYSGPEMQVLDDAGHPDGKSPLTSAGADYGIYPAPRGVVKPAGEWNHVRLVVDGARVEHWLNGVKVVAYTLWSPEWQALVAASKFKEWPGYGLHTAGRIALQDHGNWVAYRNIKLRILP